MKWTELTIYISDEADISQVQKKIDTALLDIEEIEDFEYTGE